MAKILIKNLGIFRVRDLKKKIPFDILGKGVFLGKGFYLIPIFMGIKHFGEF